MKLTKQILRDKYKIYNPYMICVGTKTNVYIDYTPANSRLIDLSAEWVVYRLDEHLINRSPVYGRNEKNDKLQKTLSWASQKFGISEWEKSPFGSYHPKGTLEKLIKTEKGNATQNT